MGCSYSPSTDILNILDYTSDVYCDCAELYTQDKAGTLELRTAIAAAQNLSLIRPVRPADEIALKLDLIITNHSVNGAVTLTGKNKDGGAQTEVVSITGNGTFTTTKWFKSIDNAGVDCTGTYTIKIEQGQWGVIWRGDIFYNDYHYKITCKIHLGDASHDAYFGDKNKVIFSTRNWDYFITSEAGKGHIYLGERSSVSEKTGKNGCIIKSNVYASGIIHNPAELFCYDSVFSNDAPWMGFTSVDLNDTVGEIWNSRFNNVNIKEIAGDVDLYGLTFSDSADVAFGNFSTAGNMNDISVYECKIFFEVYPGISVSIKNVVGRHIKNYLGLFFQDNEEVHYATNWDVSWDTNDYIDSLFYWSGSCPDAILYRQYTLNLKVIDKDGNGIGNATVILKDKDGNTADQKGFNTTTSDADATRGKITEQTVKYGYYNQANGDTLQSYSPHTLTISKAGYQTYTKKFTLDEKIDWRIALTPARIHIDQECYA